MAITFDGSISINISGNLGNINDLTSDASPIRYNKVHNWTSGTAIDQANMMWSDTRTLAASTTEDIDLAGVLTNAFGSTITFTRIKAIMISAAATNVNNVVIGGDANALVGWVGATNDLINVRPGGTFLITAPDATAYAVTAGTGDILQIANSSSGSSVIYDIVLIGNV